ncbi:hypothetical protein [Actinomyces trachealis]|uniref:N-acetylmuramoyl-L-alanine amidase family protein n=1 Tax=Actinomyces trachealis TaxID=2763540 RepID=UPI002E2E0FEF|nr:hypothetical protein [Actinomyces trachealis]
MAEIWEQEPNDRSSKANHLPLGVTVHGTCRSSNWFDVDYYYVDVPSDGKLIFDFQLDNATGAGKVYEYSIMTPSESVLYSGNIDLSQSDGAFHRGSPVYLAAGRYLIRVGSYKNVAFALGVEYRLTVDHEPMYVERERNDKTTSATPLTGNKAVRGVGRTPHGGSGDCRISNGDCDVFSYDVAQAGKLNIDLRFPKNLGTGRAYTVKILDAKGDILTAFDVQLNEYSGGQMGSRVLFVPRGRLYIAIGTSNHDPTWWKPYTLFASVTPMYAELPHNDSTASATPLEIGRPIAASILRGYYNSHDVDYFRVSSPAAASRKVTLGLPSIRSTETAYRISFINAAGETVAGPYDVTPAASSWSKSVPFGAGANYIKVEGRDYWPSHGKQYTLKVEGASFARRPAPKVTGSSRPGSVLKASVGSWSPKPTGLSYRWLRDGKPIPKATGLSYKTVSADVNHKISFRVTATSRGYNTTTKTSAPIVVRWAAFAKAPTPVITGKYAKGSKLSVNAGSWSPKPTRLAYQWMRDGKPIPKARQKTYKLTAADMGHAVSCRVTATLPGYAKTTRLSIPLKTGWFRAGGKRFWGAANGRPVKGWKSLSGSWYYFAPPTGQMATGWVKDGGSWYYMAASGQMRTGWVKDGGSWYYMAASGQMATGWVKDGGSWYYMAASGQMATGWVKDGGSWYYMAASGQMRTGWVKDGGSWYYMGASGQMRTGWQVVDGRWSLFSGSGVWLRYW